MNIEYNDAIDFLYNQLPAFERVGDSAYKPGLERVLKLSSIFGNPHEKLKKVIHVAGTNGKGSTAHTLAAILQSAGYKTGLFTSPHLVDFRERMRINGEMISKQDVINFVNRFKAEGFDIFPSFFELTTILAFKWFAESNVDIAVVEVGLGGRLDSTNIVNPDLCIITNISLDHTSLLGETQESIAYEKGGIIKNNICTIIGEADENLRRIFNEIAESKKSEIVFAEDIKQIVSVSRTNHSLKYNTTSYGEFIGELSGDYQPKNSSTVLTAISKLRQLGFNITKLNVTQGFGSVSALTGLQGRWMKISDSPIAICDTGHNPGGWSYLVKQINELPGQKHIIVGFVADKDVVTILQMIASTITNSLFYFTAPNCPRRLEAHDLMISAKELGLEGEYYDDVRIAYKKALAACDKGDSIFIGGSNYVTAELLSIIEN